LKKACSDQEELEHASSAFVLAAMTTRLQREFGDRGMRLALLECGHIAQNLCLQATALSLGALTYGKIDAVELRSVLDIPETEEPVYVILAGPKF
jgi:SagB-type dehydrogenase family enzyme